VQDHQKKLELMAFAEPVQDRLLDSFPLAMSQVQHQPAMDVIISSRS
jgi:hypothetical protein